MTEVKNTKNAEHYVWGDVCEGWRLLDGSDLSVIQERIPPGAGEVRHYHAKARQLFYVLQGELEIELGEERRHLAQGDSLEVPPGVPHLVRNEGFLGATFLVISSPTTHGDRSPA